MNDSVHDDLPHESAARHVFGTARYTDDFPDPPQTLWLWIVPSPVARGQLIGVDATAAAQVPGFQGLWTAKDIPGHLTIGPIVHDEPLLASDALSFFGQAVAVVAADTREGARLAAAAVRVDVAAEEPLIGIDAAIALGSFHGTPHTIQRGDLDAAFASAHLVVEGELRTPGQDHFYLECHSALCVPDGEDGLHVRCSTQHPTEVQRDVARVLGIGEHLVRCEVPRLGGGFGGKESQATPFAVLTALVTWATGRPARIRLDRGQDMGWTGKRHPFLGRYRTAFDSEGRVLAHDVALFSDGGWSWDLSGPVLDRALFHLDNAIFIPALRFVGRVCKTNTVSNTAFRGFGGPQGMAVTHAALQEGATQLGLTLEELFARNLYAPGRDRTPYGQLVPDPRGGAMLRRLSEVAEIAARRQEIERWNRGSPLRKRGLSVQVVQFGISFTNSLLNQAGALVLVYADGTVQVNHGGTEMGQGLHTKMRGVARGILGVPTSSVRVMPTSTEKVPNTSATAASSGSDLNGAAVSEACHTIRDRLAELAAELWAEEGLTVEARDLRFHGGKVHTPGGRSRDFGALCATAWVRRRSLSAVGYYRTPGIAYDRDAGRGTPFFYFAYGVAFAEVEVCGLTGESRLRRVDILHDCGRSLNPRIDRGQVEGAFVQGLGWLTNEDVVIGPKGEVRTRGPSTYKIPTAGDLPAPEDFRVSLLDNAPQDGVVGGSKAVGEPPFMLALAVLGAYRDAVAAFAEPGRSAPPLLVPATPEHLLHAVSIARGAQWG